MAQDGEGRIIDPYGGQDDLKAGLISQVQDLQQALPSTNAAFSQPRVSSVAVRGIGSNPANEGLEGSVGLVVDELGVEREITARALPTSTP